MTLAIDTEQAVRRQIHRGARRGRRQHRPGAVYQAAAAVIRGSGVARPPLPQPLRHHQESSNGQGQEGPLAAGARPGPLMAWGRAGRRHEGLGRHQPGQVRRHAGAGQDQQHLCRRFRWGRHHHAADENQPDRGAVVGACLRQPVDTSTGQLGHARPRRQPHRRGHARVRVQTRPRRRPCMPRLRWWSRRRATSSSPAATRPR